MRAELSVPPNSPMTQCYVGRGALVGDVQHCQLCMSQDLEQAFSLPLPHLVATINLAEQRRYWFPSFFKTTTTKNTS